MELSSHGVAGRQTKDGQLTERRFHCTTDFYSTPRVSLPPNSPPGDTTSCMVIRNQPSVFYKVNLFLGCKERRDAMPPTPSFVPRLSLPRVPPPLYIKAQPTNQPTQNAIRRRLIPFSLFWLRCVWLRHADKRVKRPLAEDARHTYQSSTRRPMHVAGSISRFLTR